MTNRPERIPPHKHKGRRRYTPITLELKKNSRDFRFLIGIVTPTPEYLFNTVTYYPIPEAEKRGYYRFVVRTADFSQFFKRLTYYATRPAESGLHNYTELASGWLGDIIFHLYGYNAWGYGRERVE